MDNLFCIFKSHKKNKKNKKVLVSLYNHFSIQEIYTENIYSLWLKKRKLKIILKYVENQYVLNWLTSNYRFSQSQHIFLS